MKALVFGASGMVGQGLVRESLLDPEVESVLSVVRNPSGQDNTKLTELVHKDFFDFSAVESQLRGYDACFFCIGVTSSGLTEAEYSRAIYDMTLAVAEPLARLNPEMVFVFVSGQGTDSTEKGRVMWARIKGKTENALFRLPFKAVFAFRPGIIQPLHGIKSKTASYRVLYALTRPVLPILRTLFPQYVTTTEILGRAMIRVARDGYRKRILESRDINQVLL